MSGAMLRLMYSCHECGVEEREIEVLERTPGENICAWVKHVAERAAIDHSHISPDCLSEHVDLKIPVPPGDDAYIGQAQRQ